jgi:predicted phage-related endonuclease
MKGNAPWEDATERMETGKALEPLICQWYEKATARKVIQWPQTTVAIHPDLDYLVATPDATQYEYIGKDKCGGPVGLLELKTSEFWADSAQSFRKGEIPLDYQVQIQTQFACLPEFTWGSLAGKIGLGDTALIGNVEPNPEFISVMLKSIDAFLDSVRRGVEPAPDGSERTTDIIKAMYQADTGATVTLAPEFLDADARLVAIKAQLKALEDEKGELENRVKAAIGDATWGIMQGSHAVYRWQLQQRKGYTVAPSESRVLLRMKWKNQG